MTTIVNGSFERLDWTDILRGPGSLNQQPYGWELTWLEPGQLLWDSGDRATATPECVHKIAEQLPPSQQLGGSDALILDGRIVYKMFNGYAAFGAQLRQVITGLEPGSLASVDVPVQIHRHGDKDEYAAEVGAWVNGLGYWSHPPDRKWEYMRVSGIVDENGEVVVLIRVKSKWALGKDFFIDNISADLIPADEESPEPPETKPGTVAIVTLFSDGTGRWEAVA